MLQLSKESSMHHVPIHQIRISVVILITFLAGHFLTYNPPGDQVTFASKYSPPLFLALGGGGILMLHTKLWVVQKSFLVVLGGQLVNLGTICLP